MHIFMTFGIGLALAMLMGQPADPGPDVERVPSQRCRVASSPAQQYFLIGPPPDTDPPEAGYGLLVVLPGGDGGEEFHPFVKRLYANAAPPGYLAVQPIAVRWTASQPAVWPTQRTRVTGQEFTTEAFVAAVVKDAAGRQKIDPRKVLVLAWSSSGPAAYEASSIDRSPVTGSFIAMSVFRPEMLGDTPLKGRRYFLYHSPEDRRCPYRMARTAYDALKSRGASVRFQTYPGGHGWQSPTLYHDVQGGLAWLDAAAAAQAASRPATRAATRPE